MSGMPRLAASLALATATSIDRRQTPGIDKIGSSLPLPSTTKIGQIKSAAVSWFSRTKSRSQGVRRLRLMRVEGNLRLGLSMMIR